MPRTVSHHLDLPTITNCRDLGGIPNTHGQRIRPGMLIRSANLHHARQADLEVLNALGITNIIDLRTAQEREFENDKLLPGWQLYDWPTFDESEVARTQLRDIVTRPGTFMEDLYPHFIVDDTAVECWRKMFRAYIDQPGGYLFHCTQGKDRTGVAAALILAALDVDEELIRDDYLQTNLYMEQETPHIITRLEHHMGPRMRADIDEFLVAAPLYYQTFVDATEPYGGLKGYLQERVGLTDADLQKFNELYLEDIPQA